jgi:hypothetical protein
MPEVFIVRPENTGSSGQSRQKSKPVWIWLNIFVVISRGGGGWSAVPPVIDDNALQSRMDEDRVYQPSEKI